MGCDIVDTRMTGSHRERLPLTEDIKAYPVFQPTTGVGDITRVTRVAPQDWRHQNAQNALLVMSRPGMILSAAGQTSGHLRTELVKKSKKRQQIFFNKNYLADIALVVLVQPALLTVPILQHTSTHPGTRY